MVSTSPGDTQALNDSARPLRFLKGVGPRKAQDLAREGLVTIEDLLCRLPFRYEDRRAVTAVASLRPALRTCVVGEIRSAALTRTRRRGFTIFRALLSDSTGSIRCVWMNQPFLAEILTPGTATMLFGDVTVEGSGLQLLNPEVERESDEVNSIRTGRIVPFYTRVGAVTPNMRRALVREALMRLPQQVPDLLPEALRQRLGLLSRHAALEAAHFPKDDVDMEALAAYRTPAQRRLIFEELFLFQLGHAWRRRLSRAEPKPFIPLVDDRIRHEAARALPFRLTPGQRTAVKEIVDDMCRPAAMHRLLQGDVGAGKTMVALLAAIVAMENQFQVAFMAPTEILAVQHHATLAMRMDSTRYRVALLTGSTSPGQRTGILNGLKQGTIHLVVGTHALVQEGVAFHRLGLAIIDEQHRFGVAQRAALRQKGLNPDVLLMTATPIPRTLALTDYAELDVSKVEGLPPGRSPVQTDMVPDGQRGAVYEWLRGEFAASHQAYMIYPLVDESEYLDVRSATAMVERLAQDVFPECRVALLHGRMKPEEKSAVMQAFSAGRVQLLVSTTVVEVGVDVPNATAMIIEHADRFGLSQLHQLRGRVGRGHAPSRCVLMYQMPMSEEAHQRLQSLTATHDGFRIAERDLELRGPGDVFGTRQSGMPTLRTGDLVRDRDIMEEAQGEARKLVESGTLPEPLAQFVEVDWLERFALMETG